MGNMLPEIGDLFFTIIIGYLGALELMYVVRHLYHWSLQHAATENSQEHLTDYQQSLQKQLSKAEEAEAKASGRKVMRDGVQYEDGFRVEPKSGDKDQRHQELEKELAKQKQIEEETRQQLQQAEQNLERQRREKKEREQAETAENERKLWEAEKQREQQQEREENERQILQAEREREAQQEAAENEQRLLESERQREKQQRALEEEEEDRKATEIVMQLLEAERERELLEQQRLQQERELKEKLIEENARKFMEAEQEMVEKLQQYMQQEAHAPKQTEQQEEELVPITEELCIKKQFKPHYQPEQPMQTIKTQFGQGSKNFLFPDASDEGSSAEPNSSEQSCVSNQHSEDLTTGNEDSYTPLNERQEPEGEDTLDSLQFTDEYLRSLDGIKQKPLVREDGSGRRRAFKKRRSSGSSNSSRDSRASRDEELKMFTSLEEEEMAKASNEDDDFVPIKYTSEPTLKIKGHRRHKRSPAKDAKTSDDSLRGSLEMLDEENVDPWGEVVPETYKNTEFWRREKALSIDEEVIELPKFSLNQEESNENEATNMPHTSEFEEANTKQNEKAMQKLTNQNDDEKESEEPTDECVKWETQVNNAHEKLN